MKLLLPAALLVLMGAGCTAQQKNINEAMTECLSKTHSVSYRSTKSFPVGEHVETVTCEYAP